MSEHSPSKLGPVASGQRIEAVDMVRGFALFGVLLVNMFNFGASSAIWTNPVDEWSFAFMRFFFETKSWRLFSFLFGLGFSMQLLQAQDRGTNFLPFYLRRLGILFVFGMAHALIFPGDILMLYAELGLVLVAFRKSPPNLLLIVAILLLMAFPVGRAVTSLAQQRDTVVSSEDRLKEKRAEIEEIRRSHPYAVGSLVDVMAVNREAIPANPFSDLSGPESSLAMFAMFLLGLYVGRRRILQDSQKNMPLIRRVLCWGLPVGLLSMTGERILNATTGYTVFGEQSATVVAQFFGDVVFTFGSTALSLGYAAGIVVLAQHRQWKRLVSPLGAVGRLALTVYLTQSLMHTTLFYGYGFGQAFRIGPAAVTGYAILIFAVMVAGCVWWSQRFRFGPMEWLWRSLTYMQFQPFRL